MLKKRLPRGTRVRVVQEIHQTDPSYRAETAGVIESWDEEPTATWYAHGRNGRLWLERLRLRKADGEISVLAMDPHTRVQSIATVAD